MVTNYSSHSPMRKQTKKLRKVGPQWRGLVFPGFSYSSLLISVLQDQASMIGCMKVSSVSAPSAGLPPPSDKYLRNLNPFCSQQRSTYTCIYLAAVGFRPGALAGDLSRVINTCECKLGRSKQFRSERLIFKFQTCRHNSEIPWLIIKFTYQIKSNICLTELQGSGVWAEFAFKEIGGLPRMEFCEILAENSFQDQSSA